MIIVVVGEVFTRSSLLAASPGIDSGNPGGAVSRYEGKIGGEGVAAAEAAEILAALGREPGRGARDRQDAVRCYLAAGDGWKEASELLGGAFADSSGLTQAKDE